MKKLLISAAILVASTSMASAYTAQSLLHEFNNIVLNNLDASAETEGTLYVGGNISGSGYTVNSDHKPNGDLGGGIAGSLVVGGNVQNVLNFQFGDAQIGGAITGTLNNNGGGTINTGVAGIPTAAIANLLQMLSMELATNPTTPGGIANTGDPNLVSFASGAGDADMIQFFNISSAVLSGGNITDITSPAGVTTIINVSGANPTVGINANNNSNKGDVLFNFYEATSLTINTTFNYSILAPKATVTLNGGGMFATLVSYNLDQNAEVRPYNGTSLTDFGAFNGSLPTVEPTATPVPGALALILGGIAGITVLARRKA